MVGQRTAKKASFEKRLRNLRNERGLTQSALGKKVGVTATCVWNWENGNTSPRPAALAKLAAALSTSVEYLTGSAGATADSAPNSLSASDQSQQLANLVQKAREDIAAASGLSVGQVRVVLDYSG